MKLYKYSLVVTVFLLLCAFTNTESFNSVHLYQKWIPENYQSGTYFYKSTSTFKKDKPGIELRKGGTLIHRHNVGGCGMPPITYESIEGKWLNVNDSVLVLQYKDWRGLNNDTMQILELSKSKLKLKLLSTQL